MRYTAGQWQQFVTDLDRGELNSEEIETFAHDADDWRYCYVGAVSDSRIPVHKGHKTYSDYTPLDKKLRVMGAEFSDTWLDVAEGRMTRMEAAVGLFEVMDAIERRVLILLADEIVNDGRRTGSQVASIRAHGQYEASEARALGPATPVADENDEEGD